MTAIEENYINNHPRSSEFYQKSKTVFSSGVTHDTRYVSPFPIVIEKANGSHKTDIDGNEYIDYVMGHGALILGHAHPTLIDAVNNQISKGTHLGGETRLGLEWAQIVQHLIPSIERIRFHSSGTEATLMAMRLARAYTGKSTILRFQDHFHGWQDYSFAIANQEKSNQGTTAGPGIPSELGKTVKVIPDSDIENFKNAIREDNDIAAVILEPTGARTGQIPLNPDFVHAIRDLTLDNNILLIFDEVVTGFRITKGGAQQRLKIKPDLTTLAKILAGGLPGGAVGGKAEIIDLISFENNHKNTLNGGRIQHPGTFNANPLSAAAGTACLRTIANQPINERADQAAQRLCKGINEAFFDAKALGFAYCDSSWVTIAPNIPFNDKSDLIYDKLDLLRAPKDKKLLQMMRLCLLNEGIDAMRGDTLIVSAVHDDNDIDKTILNFRSVLNHLLKEKLVAKR